MYFVVLKAIILTLFYEKSNLEYNSRVLIQKFSSHFWNHNTLSILLFLKQWFLLAMSPRQPKRKKTLNCNSFCVFYQKKRPESNKKKTTIYCPSSLAFVNVCKYQQRQISSLLTPRVSFSKKVPYNVKIKASIDTTVFMRKPFS